MTEAPRWLVVSAYDNEASALRAQAAGAQGFLSKRDAGDGLLSAIRSVASENSAFHRYPESSPDSSAE